MSFKVTYTIICDHCPATVGQDCKSRTEVRKLALELEWQIQGRHHMCPNCKQWEKNNAITRKA